MEKKDRGTRGITYNGTACRQLNGTYCNIFGEKPLTSSLKGVYNEATCLRIDMFAIIVGEKANAR